MKYKEELPKYLWAFILLCLLLPVVQHATKYFKEKPLGGFMTQTLALDFSKDNWFSGEYQAQKEKKLSEVFGFRGSSIRIHNQITYSLFKRAQAKTVVVGKESYLYERDYIKSYYGTDFIGEDSIRERMEKLKFVCDTFSKLNKTVIIVFAAGKGFYYPEYFPDRFDTVKTTTNMERYAHYARQFGIKHIDFNQYFVECKPKYKHLLYPQHGVHWSVLGSDIAADSIVRYIEKARGIDMPNLYWNDNETVYGPDNENDTDYDIANGMNLLFKFQANEMAYPNIKVESEEGKTRPNVLVIGDSFYWCMYGRGVTKAFSEDSHFWYYNKYIYPGDGSKTTELTDIKAELEKHDVIIILATPSNLPAFAWGFIENTHKIFTKKAMDFATYRKKVEDFKAFIRSEKNWLDDSRKRAIAHNITLDSSITLDAIYQVKRAIELEE